MKKNKIILLALLPFLVVVLLFEIFPVVMVIVRSFSDGLGSFTLEHYLSAFTKKLYQTAIINSVIISVVSSFIGILIAFIAAQAFHTSSSQKKGLFVNILNMTSNFAGVPLAFSYMILLGSAGVITNFGIEFGIDALANFDLYTVFGLLIIYIYFQIPLATLLLIPSFKSLKVQWKEAVSLLGGSSFDYWFKVAIPSLMPSILGTFSVLFANALAAYATAYALLSGNLSLLPIRISEMFVGDVLQRPEFGAALAVILMALMVISIIVKEKVIDANHRRVKN